ncbi:MAG: hypothetical protein K9J74_01300 [Sulfuritalea sp.]|nr:hypothetical protein [Sulfuritalea sp.]
MGIWSIRERRIVLVSGNERRRFLGISGAMGLIALGGPGSDTVETLFRRFERAKIVGVGGAGRNIVNQLAQSRLQGVVECIGVDLYSPRYRLQSFLDSEIQLHVDTVVRPATRENVQMTAWRARDQFARAIAGADTVIVVAGLGGLAGNEIAPIVANQAFNSSAFTSAVLISPFEFEGFWRSINASRGLTYMNTQSDRTFHVSNSNIARRLPSDIKIGDATFATDIEAIAAVKMFLNTPA